MPYNECGARRPFAASVIEELPDRLADQRYFARAVDVALLERGHGVPSEFCRSIVLIERQRNPGTMTQLKRRPGFCFAHPGYVLAMPAFAAGGHIAARRLINCDIAGVAVVMDITRDTRAGVEVEVGVGVDISITPNRDGPQCTEIGIVELSDFAGWNRAVGDIWTIRQRARTARTNKPDIKVDIGIIVEMAGAAGIA